MHTKRSIYFMYTVYRKFYSSRCVVIHEGMLCIWKPQLLLCLIGLTFWGKNNLYSNRGKSVLK